ncbi:uncharacterized protein LOC125492828 [Beta vulgaris subsp. vulgaris]|uniref:uncharacterized protein LOC125492828 n=1 Tax=Beta vulgaris subsp. vulgaris TaxID=3555 RepID=UPI0020371044|nr:uncharacterized protein LOC125492828 [Beta vulgaris subsp. vulgaris]
MTIPKHRFFMWLTMKNKMQTTARLFTIGVSRDPMCQICGLAEEAQDHLFLNCVYSCEVLKTIKRCMMWNTTSTNVLDIYRYIKRSRMSRMWKQTSYAVLAASVYQIWSVRNDAFWS